MKSFFIWLIAVIIGGMSGFGITYLIGWNAYLTIGMGIIFGSSAGVTINIHRERDDDIPVNKPPQKSDSDIENSDRINQKAS